MRIELGEPASEICSVQAGVGTRPSLNEIEALCLKASRGAGMSWGMAEEAGFAARWLSARGIDGPSALLAYLEEAAGRDWDEVRPTIRNGEWAAAGDTLCPIGLGTALSDFAALPAGVLADGVLRTGLVNRPVLVLPFLGDLAKDDRAIRLSWAGGRVTLAANEQVTGDVAGLARTTRTALVLSLCKAAEAVPGLAAGSLTLSAATLSGLEAFALRTTVPASEASRAGAGSDLGDND
jgi:Protein of unknown function (DUF3726)